MLTKILAILVLPLALAASGGAYYGYSAVTASTPSCCQVGAPCCELADCCYPGAECCELGLDCCNTNACCAR